MSTQKVMFLGAAPMELPSIRYAKKWDYQVITVDYKPADPGHKLADCWCDYSITNLDDVLDIAQHEDVDGKNLFDKSRSRGFAPN